MNDVDFKVEALKTGLRRLFRESHFDIWLFRELCKMANVSPPQVLEELLRTLHCTAYSEMKKNFRDALFKRVLEVFSLEPKDVLTTADDGPRRGWWKRMLGV